MQAVTMYQRIYSERITLESIFGVDPLSQSIALKQQREIEHASINDIATIFGDAVNNRPRSFQRAVMSFIEITNRLALQL